MPVLATMAAVSVLFLRGSDGRAGLLAPGPLRARLEALEEPARARALGIADRLDTLAPEWDASTAALVDLYGRDLQDPGGSAAGLLEPMKEQDEVRERILRDLVELRQELLETLSPEEWAQVFA